MWALAPTGVVESSILETNLFGYSVVSAKETAMPAVDSILGMDCSRLSASSLRLFQPH